MKWSLSKNSFYFDHFFFATLSVGLFAYLLYQGFPIIAVATGIFVWTLFEYILHRWIFHILLRYEHALHHQNPSGFIGAPNFVSIGSFLTIYAILWAILPFEAATGIALGLSLGYLFYLYIHHLTHHRIVYPDQLFYRLREAHKLHHHQGSGNFGISTPLWDWVFWTKL